MTYSTAASTTVMATIRMVAITGDTAASSFRMMLFMVLSSCGLRRHLGTGEPTLLNVSWLIFEVENEFIRARAAREKSPNRNRPTQAFRSGFLRRRNSTFSMMFSSMVGLSTMIEWEWRFAWDIMICVMQSTNQMCSTGISRASIAFRMLWLGIVDVT